MDGGVRRRAALIALPVVLGLIGCTEFQAASPAETGTGGETTASEVQGISDLPVPAGATFDVESSIVLGGGDRWTGRLILKLDESDAEAFALYQREMPGFGWQPMMSVRAKSSVLGFVRGDRVATVQIEGRTLGGSTVAVTVAPRHAEGASPAIVTTPIE